MMDGMCRRMCVSNARRLISLPMFRSGWMAFWMSIIVTGRNGTLLCLNILRRKLWIVADSN